MTAFAYGVGAVVTASRMVGSSTESSSFAVPTFVRKPYLPVRAAERLGEQRGDAVMLSNTTPSLQSCSTVGILGFTVPNAG